MSAFSLITRIDQALAEAFKRSPKSPLRLCLKAEDLAEIEGNNTYRFSISHLMTTDERTYRGVRVVKHTANKVVYEDPETGKESSVRV